MPQPADQAGAVVLRPLAAADNPGEYPHSSQEQSRTGKERQLRQGQNGGQGIAEQDDGLEHNKSQPFCRGAGFSRAPFGFSPSGGVAQRGKDADADGQQTGRNEQDQQGIAGHQVPAFAHELNHGIQSAHNCAHPAAGYHGRGVTHVIASFPQNFICNTFHAAAARQRKEKCVTI